MNKHLIPFEPKTSIEEYLKDDFYKEIYAEISNDSSDELPEPLEYLNLLAQHIELSNQVEVFDVVKHLQALNLKDYQLYLLYTHLISYQNHISQAIGGIIPQTISTYIKILSQSANKLKEKMQSEGKRNQNLSSNKYIFDGYTNAQVVLIFYYFFVYLKLEPRSEVDMAPIAKFIHLVLGKEFTTTQNSEFYKKLSKAPNFNSDKQLIKDLLKIRPLFEKVQLDEVVEMIDKEMRTAQEEKKRVNK